MDKQTYLSNLSQYEGLSLREISRRSGHHFNTVKKYVSREDWNSEYRPRKERGSLLDPLKPVIDGWIEEDMKRQRKYRRTATKIYNDLCKDKEHSKLLAVGKQTVINYVSLRKKELCKKAYQTAMFGLHAMCEAQVDFWLRKAMARRSRCTNWLYRFRGATRDLSRFAALRQKNA